MAEPTPLLQPVKPAQVRPRLWRDGHFVADPWHPVGDDEALAVGEHIIVSLARWRSERDELVTGAAMVGVRLAVAEGIDPVRDDLEALGVIELPFPKFSDGRGYSTARRLRDAGFRAEIRAAGDVLLDQLPLMLRAGFDAFLITHGATIRALEQGAVPAISKVFQAGAEVSRAARFARRGALA